MFGVSTQPPPTARRNRAVDLQGAISFRYAIEQVRQVERWGVDSEAEEFRHFDSKMYGKNKLNGGFVLDVGRESRWVLQQIERVLPLAVTWLP